MRKSKVCGARAIGAVAVAAVMSLAVPGGARAQVGSYLDHDGLTREIRSLTQGSDLVRMRSLAKTLGGRDVWMLEVANPAGAPLDERPAVLVVANLEGDQLVGSALALEAVRYLRENATEGAVKTALDTQVFYVIPRLNPDGAEARFADVVWERTTNDRAVDDDNDGRVNEDGPEDLNGDGYVTVMRVKDPDGAFLADSADPRVLRRADATKGESGVYALYLEGTDEDGDGFINEDGPGGVDLNRNFQHEYPYWQADAGPYMVSEAETRALMDFVLAHRNIAAVLTFGESDNLVTPPDSRGALAAAKILDLPMFAAASNEGVFDVGVFTQDVGRGFRGGFGGRRGADPFLRGAQLGRDNDPSSGQRPATTVASPDQPYFQAVSDAYKEITGIGSVPLHRTPEGAFFQYAYFQYGVPSFSTPGWSFPEQEGGPSAAPAGERPAGAAGGASRGGRPGAQAGGGSRGGSASAGAGADAQVLKELDAMGVQGFVDWTPFRHPTLGDVEIGGFVPYAATNPPAEQLPELGEKQGEFLVALAGMLPRLRIADTEVTSNGGGVFTIEVAVENAGFFPTALQHGVRSRAAGPTQVQIQVDPSDILTGADKTVTVTSLAGSGARERWTWVIRGRQGDTVTIKARSQKAGTDTATVTLR